MNDYNWEIVLGGRNKSSREKTRDYLKTIKKRDFELRTDVSGYERIATMKIVSNPNFNNLDELKSIILEKSLEYIKNMDIILQKG